MAAPKVIIFGPTGAVGSSAALTASLLGSPVTLAMRNTSAPIPALESSKGSFTRIYADLADPTTVLSAVTTSGATHAFIYPIHGSPDAMLATIKALKDGGVTFVVLLSSFTVQADTLEELKATPKEAIIPYMHAQVEVSLWEVFGPGGFVAIRPGSFATNSFAHAKGMAEEVVKVLGPGIRCDSIVQEDIGRVAGTVLVRGEGIDGERAVCVLGPETMTQRDLVGRIARALGREVKVEAQTGDEARRVMVEVLGRPKPLVDYMVEASLSAAENTSAPAGKVNVFGLQVDEKALRNHERYTGKKGMLVEEWVEKNKGKWEELLKNFRFDHGGHIR